MKYTSIVLLKIFVFSFFCFNTKICRSQNEEFQWFIAKFATDSVFQIKRIAFPLTYITWDYIQDKELTVQLDKSKYKFDRLYYVLEDHGDAYSVFYDNFDCKFRDTGEMVFRWAGFTSMDRRYYFKRIEEKWFLIKIFDYDPIK